MTNLEIIKRLKTAKDLYDKDTKPGSDKNGGMCHYMNLLCMVIVLKLKAMWEVL